ncbi:aldo/keto reductase [Amycolatopsis deserti]|uniref:Aldo/keto reductase n=1 Tax=Amycolatopsis deserti TaxID=185696 RepID=A0ABQ3IZ07_9PSEU|nr:aldo/keto reductase family protein [Amycolatopsis deserti]GHE98782.1 aldo/keto reductase [Amycolatopsis deserti]
MEYRRVGRWGLHVSAVSLGSWLTYGGGTEVDTAIKCVHRAFDLGVNTFDTANEYQNGQAEVVLGSALRDLPRDDYLVATKVCLPTGTGPLNRGLSRKHIHAQVDHSLTRLGLDHIDLYQCHRFDPDAPVEETARAMNDLVTSGKILYWGVSEWSADQLEHVVSTCRDRHWAEPISNQPQYSALWRSAEERVLPVCRQLGLGVLAWSPLAMGVLTGKYRPGADAPSGSRGAGGDAWFLDRYLKPGVLEAVQEFRALAEDAGLTAAQLALAWCLDRPGVSSVIVGATALEQLEENLSVVDLQPDRELLDKADDALAEAASTLSVQT